MKMYTTMNPGSLMADTRKRLVEDGYLISEIPQWWLADYRYSDRSVRMGPDETVSNYWYADFTLYGDDSNTVHSPYRPAHKTWDEFGRDRDIYAASYQQWGIWLGALYDVVNASPGDHIKVSAYDPTAKRASLSPQGERFDSSGVMFHWITCGQFSDEMRARQTVDLSCRNHRWEGGDLFMRCSKCDHLHRMGW